MIVIILAISTSLHAIGARYKEKEIINITGVTVEFR
jgi:hypothetical protein